MIDLLISVPEATDADQLPKEVQQAIASVGGVWAPGGTMPGTRAHEGRRLIHALVDAPVAHVAALISGYGLDWQILGAVDDERDEDGARIHRVPLSPDLVSYLPDLVTRDEDGNEVSRTRPTAWVPTHIYGGREW